MVSQNKNTGNKHYSFTFKLKITMRSKKTNVIIVYFTLKNTIWLSELIIDDCNEVWDSPD